MSDYKLSELRQFDYDQKKASDMLYVGNGKSICWRTAFLNALREGEQAESLLSQYKKSVDNGLSELAKVIISQFVLHLQNNGIVFYKSYGKDAEIPANEILKTGIDLYGDNPLPSPPEKGER